MRFVFFSNYLCIHQLPFCENLYKKLGEDFCFVATEEIEKERLSQGYSDLNSKYPFVLRTYESEKHRQKAMQLAAEADVVLLGSAPMEYLRQRLHERKVTFLYSERIYRTGYQAWKLPVRLVRFWKKYGRHKSLYMLCASAYTAGDYAKTGTFLSKTYKWGYFPETKYYDDIDALLDQKKPASILWVARFLALKHPEYVLEVARRLKEENYDFNIQMMGSGELWDSINQQIRELGLQDCIQLIGAIPAEQVRSYMDAASIFLFTSDRNEGWGAVLNESMNSGCAVVADGAIGSVPFLLKDGENGMIYHTCDVDDLYQKVKYLLDHPQACREMGKKAGKTVTELWNAEVATERLLALSEAIIQGQKHPGLFKNGPCSKAEIIKDKY